MMDGNSKLDKLLYSSSDIQDLTLAALLVSTETFPNIDVDSYLQKIESWAYELRMSLRDKTKPRAVINVVNEFIFQQKGFKRKTIGCDPSLMLLNRVIDGRKSNCTGLATVYLAIGQKAGIPLYGVLAPRHLFLRYDDGAHVRNIETTNYGGNFPDSYYARYLLDDAVSSAISPYLRNLTNKEFIANILVNRAGYLYGRHTQYELSLRDLNRAIDLFPTHPYAYFNRGRILQLLGKYDSARVDMEQALELMSVEILNSHGEIPEAV